MSCRFAWGRASSTQPQATRPSVQLATPPHLQPQAPTTQLITTYTHHLKEGHRQHPLYNGPWGP